MITPIVKINVIIPEITNAIADITIPVEVVLKSDGKHIDTFKNLVNGDDVKVDVSLTNRTMHLRIAPYGVVWLKL